MPLLQKLIKYGNSRAVVIPAAWLDNLERQGAKITEVQLEVDGEIKIKPAAEAQP